MGHGARGGSSGRWNGTPASNQLIVGGESSKKQARTSTFQVFTTGQMCTFSQPELSDGFLDAGVLPIAEAFVAFWILVDFGDSCLTHCTAEYNLNRKREFSHCIQCLRNTYEEMAPGLSNLHPQRLKLHKVRQSTYIMNNRNGRAK